MLLIPLMLLFEVCSLPELKKENELVKHAAPVIEGNWWQIAGNPDLGKFTSPEQQPVDFGIWEAADGTWQIWSCIRKTNEVGHTRLFHRWEGH